MNASTPDQPPNTPPGTPPKTSSDASDPTFEAVYGTLHEIAQKHFRDQPANQTLQPTALVHEMWIKLEQSSAISQVADREHLLALASRTMRQILVDHARGKDTQKRGKGISRITLSGVGADTNEWDLLELDEALTHLSTLDERQARIVELRLFGGVSAEHTALLLGISSRAVYLDWQMAKAWLVSRLGSSE